MDEVYKLPKIAFPEVTGSTVSFYSEYDGLPLKKCEVAFAATQSGTGDPSPDNIRPIIGVNSVGVADSAADPEYYPVNKLIPIPAFQDGEGDPSPSNVRQILYGLSITRDDDSELEVYGGTLNVFSGELRVEWIKHVLTNPDPLNWAFFDTFDQFYNTAYFSGDYMPLGGKTNLMCETLKPCDISERGSNVGNFIIVSATGGVSLSFPDVHTKEDAITYVNNNPITFIYKLATPEVIQLSATELQRAKEALGIATATIDLDGTRYGGTVDLVSGLMTVDRKLINAKDQTWILQAAGVSVYTATDTDNSITIEYPTGRRPILSTAFIYSNNASLPNQSCGWGGGNNNKNLFVKYDDLTTSIENWTAFINANNIEFLYYIVPFTIQLTPAQIETIQGTNTIFADTGDTTVQYIRVY